MTKPRSIAYRLYSVFVFFLFLVFAFGFFSIDRLHEFNAVSAEVRDRRLPDTRFLGDLNNYTSDFRAAEGSVLAASTGEGIASNARAAEELDRQIALAARGYEKIHHDSREAALYAQFAAQWSNYRRVSDRVFALAASGDAKAAAATYMSQSRLAYNRASDTLGRLTDLNVASAREESRLADLAYRQAVTLTSLAMVLAAMMVAASVFYIRRSISDPLLDLAASMRRVATNAADAEIAHTERRDEVGEMARAVVVFRNNAIDLAVSQRGLAEQASMLREKLEQEQRLTLLQRNFVSMASHEFRTPLTIIDGHAQRLIASESHLDPLEVSRRAGKIRGAVLRMTSLIEGLLGSSLLENKVELYLHPAPFDIGELLHEVCRLHREISPRSQIYERALSTPLIVNGDRRLLYQVFSNLLSNAIKYSPNGGLIRIAVAKSDGSAVVSVKDHGLGIPKADLEKLFERYFRGSNVSGIVGTGIGLHFVRMVTELHGGTISAESEEGSGSTFTITLPVDQPRSPSGDGHRPSDAAAEMKSRVLQKETI